ncbi:claudin-15 isoform X2 [Bos indicus]|uniref:Claudin n=1 Tax=Bos indicus TaxID=9915 RepID=A0A6P5E049_BOSIN|nr:PREDICTED: claudin-15 isoform X2 [Bos indicus]XP_027382819.1 claudin-15 isoform X2 [Bos indicus x Bos taurus]
MPVAVEIFGFFLTAVGLLMLGVTLAHSSWRVSTVHGNVITTNTIFENLWYSCATDSMGVHNCWEFPSMLALSGMVGLRCTNIGGLELSRKTKLAATAGALHILAGICGMVAVSWYAFNITRDFFNPLYAGTKYELGPALYLGWSACLLAILGGICLFSNCCCSRDRDPATGVQLPYKAPVIPAASLAARLPAAASDEEGDSSFGKYGKNAYV